MRTISALMALLLPTAAAADSPPLLLALQTFQAGAYQVKPIGAASSSSLCLGDTAPLLMGGRAAQGCSYTAIADSPDTATVTYRCAGGRSGRTELRRHANGLYTIEAQGLDGGQPFANRTEWRRTGAC